MKKSQRINQPKKFVIRLKIQPPLTTAKYLPAKIECCINTGHVIILLSN